MPTYDYVCDACGHRVEVIHGVHDPGPLECPNCHARALRKAISSPTVLYKGSGWAKKDRGASARTKAAAKSDSADSKSAKTSTESGGSTSSTSADATAGSGSSAGPGPSGSSTTSPTSPASEGD